jgi:plastocyanin
MRHRAIALVLAAAAITLIAVPASAATEDISIVSPTKGFSPKTVKDPFGTTFRWTNEDSIGHTTTQDSPLALWDSGTIAADGRFSTTIDPAGTFAYHCSIHPGMTGKIKVPVQASPDSGGTSTSFTISVADAAAPSGFTYDVQKKKDDGSWKDWKTGITSASVTFDPKKAGTYRFRARLTRSSNDAHSGWSPSDSVDVS